MAIRYQEIISQLNNTLAGRVIVPGDKDYDSARKVFYGGLGERRPALIARPANSADVARIITAARQSGLVLAVRSGGHSNAGHSLTDGGIVLDLKDMHDLHIDLASRTAWAETGLTTGGYTAEAARHGLATGFGDTATVGLGGLTLGGGVGYLVRKHGLTIDSLLAAEVVTADGRILKADAETNPDLFWAIRGGGGNFGVATRLQLRLHDVSSVFGGMLILPATAEVVAGFVAAAEAAPRELSAIANVMAAPPMPFLPPELHGTLIVFALMVYAGPAEDGQRALAPFRSLAQPLADMLHPMQYPEIYPPEDPDYHPTAVAHNMFMNRIGVSEAETILEYLRASDASMRVAQLRVLGGAVADVPVDATAYAHRKARIMVNLAVFYNGPEDRVRRQAWLDDFKAALDQGVPGAYVNFLADEGPERVRAAYPGSTWQRLVEVKRRFDPENVFRLNQNIPTAG